MTAPPDPPGPRSVWVEAPARLHFGMLDLRGALGRRFGGMGAAIPTPSLVLEASRAPGFSARGPEGERALAFAHRYAAAYALHGGARLVVHRAIPVHAGLGSGTQLALAVARALAELYGLPPDARALARGVDRAHRSGVGTWIFAHGGFVVEGGRRTDDEMVAPLLARYPMPADWRVVVAVPPGTPGMSGEAEAAAFARLPPPPEREVEHVAHLVLMALLPAVVEGDLETFGLALTDVQCVTGRWFAPAQGGAFASGASAELVHAMRDWGAAGVGQSSWGPAVYGIVAGDRSAADLAARVRTWLGGVGAVHAGPFANEGARVTCRHAEAAAR
ncbi:MAG TPA: beta-ribofuranosylaminobenzene 5'-phosphate synthase family protein [Gemmatimonadaceae bacterium]|nr:beta-ribofuranosylaminobenzene 5'-phosphate synthase family protein [Gemmatimonadaceae bacterium]